VTTKRLVAFSLLAASLCGCADGAKLQAALAEVRAQEESEKRRLLEATAKSEALVQRFVETARPNCKSSRARRRDRSR